MAEQTTTQGRDGFFGFLDGIGNIANDYWTARYGGRVEQVPPTNTGGVDPDVQRANTSGDPMIAGVPQSTLLLGFGGLLLVLLMTRS